MQNLSLACFFFFNDTATTEIYTLSLHDALPIFSFAAKLPGEIRPVPIAPDREYLVHRHGFLAATSGVNLSIGFQQKLRSEEHTSELQSRQYLVCRLLLVKKKDHAEGTTEIL